ncbi:MAG: hypothetical protein K2P92_06245 [Bdellovibrionaceae bacterium]|nr:hypothetical protein [Pseudobdellovibrionaceae bacterium]
MKRAFAFVFVFLVFGFSSHAFATEGCASDTEELTALIGHEFHTNWNETSADDGKPMMLRITEQADKLHIVFEKTRDGVWGSGDIEVCKKGSKYEIVSTAMRAGRGAPMLVRGMMNGNQKFNLQINSNSSIRVWRSGWAGNFESAE